jgi:hypothetical protein
LPPQAVLLTLAALLLVSMPPLPVVRALLPGGRAWWEPPLMVRALAWAPVALRRKATAVAWKPAEQRPVEARPTMDAGSA